MEAEKTDDEVSPTVSLHAFATPGNRGTSVGCRGKAIESVDP